MRKLLFPALAAAISGGALAGGAADPPITQGTVNVGGNQVFYRSQGSGTPLLLIHGYPLNGEMFRDNRSLANSGYQVITVDLPGFGRSVAAGQAASIDNYARVMLGFMDAMNLPNAVVGGMSMGGITALQMYRLAPGRFRGLILINTTAAPAGVAEAAMWRGTAQQVREQGVGSLVDVLMPRMLTGPSRMNRPDQVAHLAALIQAASPAGAIAAAEALASRPDARAILPTIRVPTLIVTSFEDNVTPFELSREMNAAIPGSTLVNIPAAGHAAVFEKAAQANAAMLNWLRGLR